MHISISPSCLGTFLSSILHLRDKITTTLNTFVGDKKVKEKLSTWLSYLYTRVCMTCNSQWNKPKWIMYSSITVWFISYFFLFMLKLDKERWEICLSICMSSFHINSGCFTWFWSILITRFHLLFMVCMLLWAT